jgi:hypothetical protein
MGVQPTWTPAGPLPANVPAFSATRIVIGIDEPPGSRAVLATAEPTAGEPPALITARQLARPANAESLETMKLTDSLG